MPDEQDSVAEMQTALGWGPTPAAEEQAAFQRVGGEMVADEPAAAAPAPAPAPTVPPPSVPVPGDLPNAPAPVDAVVQDAAMVKQANADATTYKAQLIQAGWEETQAHSAASQYARAQYQDAKNRNLLDAQELQNQSAAATKIGQEAGIDPALIAHYPSPASMKAAAEQFKAQNTRIAALEGSPTPKTAPQNFDSQNGGGMTNQQRKIAYATGQIDLTGAEVRALLNKR